VIYLSANNIEAEGAKWLASAIKENSTVQEIYLGGNNIGLEGAKLMAEVIKTNSASKKIYLGGNDIGTEGVKMDCRSDQDKLCATGD
jgi:Ran GTPase-activating protein (RanGAP) involved in mRNA processing and transport